MTEHQDIANTSTEVDNAEKKDPVDVYWIVANIFAIIHYLEDRFGVPAVESIVETATKIEDSMRAEQPEPE